MDIKNTLKNYAFQVLSELLKPKGEEAAKPLAAASLDDIKMDDLRREKVSLENQERKILDKLKTAEAQKRQLFEEGVRNKGVNEQRVLARRIKNLDDEARNLDMTLKVLSKKLGVVNGLIHLKTRTEVLKDTEGSSLFSNLDLAELVNYIDEATVDGQLRIEDLDNILSALGEADSMSPDMSEDPDVIAIMRAMQQAAESENNPEMIEEAFRKLDEKTNTDSEEDPLTSLG